MRMATVVDAQAISALIERTIRTTNAPDYEAEVIELICANFTSEKVARSMTFVIGAALVFGLSLDIVPDLYAQVPGWMRPLFDSSPTLATVVAVILNQLLRWGALPTGGQKPSAPAEG